MRVLLQTVFWGGGGGAYDKIGARGYIDDHVHSNGCQNASSTVAGFTMDVRPGGNGGDFFEISFMDTRNSSNNHLIKLSYRTSAGWQSTFGAMSRSRVDNGPS